MPRNANTPEGASVDVLSRATEHMIKAYGDYVRQDLKEFLSNASLSELMFLHASFESRWSFLGGLRPPNRCLLADACALEASMGSLEWGDRHAFSKKPHEHRAPGTPPEAAEDEEGNDAAEE